MKHRFFSLAILAFAALAWSSTGALAGGDVPTTFTVDDATDNASVMYTIDGSCPNPCTLREAILEANDNIAADTINFAASLNGSTITLDNHLPIVTDDLSIVGPGSALLTLDGAGSIVAAGSLTKGGHDYGYKPFDLIGDGPLMFSISGMTITNVIYNENGAAIDAEDDNVTIEDVAFIDNSSWDLDGVVYSASGTLSVTDCLFMGNDADLGDGGAIRAGGTLTVTNTDFIGNLAASGAAIYFNGSSLTVTGGTIGMNESENSGGALYVSTSGTATLTGTTLDSNSAGGTGGGIVSYGEGTLTIAGGSVSHNESVDGGGGLYLVGTSSGALTVSDTRIEGNESLDSESGGIYFAGSNLEVTGSSISDNVAAGDGGGINVGGLYGAERSLSITSSTIAGNQSDGSGGGMRLYLSNSGNDVTVLNTTISGNMADGYGGGLYLTTSGGNTLAITHNTITANTADFDDNGIGDGGGIYAAGDTPVVTNTILSGNSDDTTLSLSAGKAPVEAVHPDCSGSITTAGVNLIGDATGCTGTFTNDLVGSDYDAGLLGLTKVPGLPISIHDLGLASDAINAADPATCAEEDAIGQTRDPDACDIGAVESISLAIYLYNEANGGCTISARESGGISMALLLLAVAGVFAFERRRRRS